MQTTFSTSCESQPVSLHDTTGRLSPGKCYLRSFPHFSFSSSARNSIAISIAPQQDLLTSTQPQPVVSNVLISVCSQTFSETLTLSSDPSVFTRDQPLASPAICSSGRPTPLPTVSGTATSEVPYFAGHTLPPRAYGIASGHSTTHVSPVSLAGVLPTASLSQNSIFPEPSKTPSASFPQRLTVPGAGEFTSEQLQVISTWLQQPSPASNQGPNVRQLVTAPLSTISDLPGQFQHSQGSAPSTVCGIYNLSNSMPLKLSSPDEHQLPMWFALLQIPKYFFEMLVLQTNVSCSICSVELYLPLKLIIGLNFFMTPPLRLHHTLMSRTL